MESKQSLKKLFLPFVLLGVLLAIYLAWRFFGLPPEEELLLIARSYFNRYGLIILLLSAIVEGIVLVGWYYPGSLVIMIGVILAGKDVSLVVQVVSVITIGLLVAYVINFFLGKYGWYRLLLKFGLKEPLEDAKRRVAIFMSYWQPNLAALVAASAGILHFSFGRFFAASLVATVIWSAFWGTLVYFIGEAALNIVGVKFVLFVIFAWVIYRIWNRDKVDEEEPALP